MTLPAALQPLAAYHQFVLCEFVPDPARPGKTNKYPLTPAPLLHAKGYTVPALGRWDAHDPQIWMPYDTAAALAATLGPAYGVGFVFTAADPFWFLDIDGCLTPHGWSPIAQTLCAMLPGAAVEISHSGQGLHIIGSGPVPPHGCKNIPLGLEFYDSLRFVALTGTNAVGDAAACPPIDQVVAAYFPAVDTQQDDDEFWTDGPAPEANPPADDDDLIARAMRSGSAAGAFGGKATFADLWTANDAVLSRVFPDTGPQQRAWDASNADAALAQHLAFWTGRDCERIQRLMERSALARDKYQREDYLRRTIGREARRCRTVYGQSSTTQKPNEIKELTDSNGVASTTSSSLTFSAAAAGAIPATVATVEAALLSAESGVRIAVDEFKGRLCIGEGDSWRLFTDNDYGHLRASLERRGFKPVSAEVIKTVVGMVADRCKFDSAQQWVAGLVWDGVPRVAGALARYYGAEDTPYTRAASEYLFTALAGRSLHPGCQADMALILVGVQGARKTSAVSALVPDPDAFGAVDLSKRDVELSRKLRGKQVVEWAELRGIAGRDKEAIKDWISQRKEEFRDVYRTFLDVYQRRCVIVGTSNPEEVLDDETGERRWLPMHAAQADVEALERDRDQLWAEGAAMWRNGGIRWQEAERLAKFEHHKFKVSDTWADPIGEWLVSVPPALPGHPVLPPPSQRSFTMTEVLTGALRLLPAQMGYTEQKRVGKILRGFGYEKKNMRTGDVVAKRWATKGSGNGNG